MRAGELRHRVSILDKLEPGDGHHGFSEELFVVASRIPALVEPLTGVSRERAMQIDPRISLRVTLRFRSGVKSGQTVRFHSADGNRDLEIVGPPLDLLEGRRELQLLCREEAA